MSSVAHQNSQYDGYRKVKSGRAEEMAAFDKLPALLREELRNTVHRCSAVSIERMLREGTSVMNAQHAIQRYNREKLLTRYMRQVWPAGHPQERGSVVGAEELGL
jgi:hypothetical protein